MKYYAVLEPRLHDPVLLFRTPDAGGPPTELWSPETGMWDEDITLLGYFTGDLLGAVEVEPAEAENVQTELREKL